MKYKKLSAVEYEFMQLLWDSRRELSFQDFNNYFVDRQWSEKTISTTLHHIVKKGFLKSTREGRVFFYEPTISRIEYQQYLLNETVNHKLGKSVEGLIAAFCGVDLSEEHLKKINKYLLELGDELRDQSNSGD